MLSNGDNTNTIVINTITNPLTLPYYYQISVTSVYKTKGSVNTF